MAEEVHGSADPMQLLTYNQACARLRISKSQLYRLMRAGEITPLKLSAQVRRISVAELDAYVRRLQDQQAGQAQHQQQDNRPAA